MAAVFGLNKKQCRKLKKQFRSGVELFDAEARKGLIKKNWRILLRKSRFTTEMRGKTPLDKVVPCGGIERPSYKYYRRCRLLGINRGRDHGYHSHGDEAVYLNHLWRKEAAK